jgi:colanic acid biosynthesis glycosyl transferase WcaI
MHILLVVPNYYPEIHGASHLYQDLAKGFIKKGHKVSVITSYPRYYFLQKKDQEKKFKMFETINGVNIYRANKIEFSRDNLLLRGIEHLLLPFLYLSKAFIVKNVDFVIIYSPALPLYQFGNFFRFLHNSPYVLNVQDLYPKTLVDVGILTNPIQIKLFNFFEKRAYRTADFITVHSEGNLAYIRSKGDFKEKSRVMYNWTDLDEVKPANKDNNFRKAENLTNKFLVTYVGIMSTHQDLESVVLSGKYIQNKEIIIYLIGDGVQREELIKLAEKEQIRNVKFLPLQPKEKYIEILQASDVGIVTLMKNVDTPVVPAKLLKIMASGTPVLSNVPEKNDTTKIIREANCGITISPGNPKQLAQTIEQFYSLSIQDRDRFGKNGRIYALTHFSIDSAVDQFEMIYKKLNSDSAV